MTGWKTVFFLFLVFAYGTDLVRAEETESPVRTSGRVYTDHFFSVYKNNSFPSGVFQSSISAWLELQLSISERTSAFVVGQGDAFLRSMVEPERASFSGKIREGYLSYQNDSLDLRVGQQIIPWGKSDGVNPTDYFTAKNYTLLNPDDEVRRMGAPALQLSFTPKKGTSPLTFTGVFQAFYPQTKLLIPDQVIPSGIQFQKYPDAPTAFQEDTLEAGFKIAYLKADFDLSLSVFRGSNHFAQYLYDFSQNRIVPKNIRQSAVGGDASFTLSSYVIRIESAYFIPDNGNENTEGYGILQPSHWDSVLGIEHTFFEHIRAQVQFLYRYHVNFLDPSLYATPNPIFTQIQQSVARANGTLLNFQRSSNLGGTFHLGYSDETHPWTLDFFLYGYFAQGQDYLLRSQLGYQASEGLKWLIGSDLYGGEETRPLGALKKNSSFFLEGRYLF